MKRLLFSLALLGSLTVQGQYVSSTFPETSYGPIGVSANIHNVGTDTRSGAVGYGNNPWYANYLNVTVSDYEDGNSGGRSMHWESSGGPTGSLALPANDALDPDVVLVEGNDPTDSWAIVVFFSQSDLGTSGYYMTAARFVPGTYSFDPFIPAMLIQPFNPSPGWAPCINIDSDNNGNYAIVFQRNSGIESRTATYTAGVPALPGNSVGYFNLIEPDVSINVHSSLDVVKIVALRSSRNRYQVLTREMGPVAVGTYNSPWMAELHTPRIASPTTMSVEYSVTMRRFTGGNSNILYNTFIGVTSLGLKTINDGSEGSPYPTAINTTDNFFPALSYHSDLGNEKLTIGWHANFVSGSPALNNSFVGLDIDPTTRLPITADNYLDLSFNGTVVNNMATLGLSGRYTDWCKTTAFGYGSTLFAPTELVWKYVNSVVPNWKTEEETHAAELLEENQVRVFPNPANDQLQLELPIAADESAQVSILDMSGRVIHQQQVTGNRSTIDVSPFAANVYFLRTQADREVHVTKFTVKH